MKHLLKITFFPWLKNNIGNCHENNPMGQKPSCGTILSNVLSSLITCSTFKMFSTNLLVISLFTTFIKSSKAFKFLKLSNEPYF